MKTADYSLHESLLGLGTFSRNDLYTLMKKKKGDISQSLANYTLQQLLKDGTIIRIGRNKYTIAKPELTIYSPYYSKTAEKVAKAIRKNHPYLDFRIFELIQLNEFVNHQIAHNVIFVSVENNLGDFVFTTLRSLYPGKVLLNPSAETYHNYVSDNSIVIERLITEAPKCGDVPWGARLEKILVDLLADKLIACATYEGELVNIIEGAFDKYIIDEDTLFRYARRRGAEDKVYALINDAKIKLRTR